jgi:hypothetical protein
MVFFETQVFANTPQTTSNIVAIVIDKDLYESNLRSNIDRYTSNYIQQKISNSKAIVFPINTTNIKARDIAKMLESLYYEGIEKKSSNLKGVILIGNKVPLPVINDE